MSTPFRQQPRQVTKVVPVETKTEITITVSNGRRDIVLTRDSATGHWFDKTHGFEVAGDDSEMSRGGGDCGYAPTWIEFAIHEILPMGWSFYYDDDPNA